MPFSHGPYDFTLSGINGIGQLPGVYGITNGDPKWIYIGEAESLRDRLKEHYNRQSDQSNCIWKYTPKKFYCEVVNGGEVARKKRETELIKEYDPNCNKE